MPYVLTTEAVITCVHGAKVVAPPSQSSLTVHGRPVLLVSDLLAATIPACPNTDTSKGQVPCIKVTALAAGASTRLSVRGTPVALATARGTTQGLPVLPPMWQVRSPGQTTLNTE
ncbi:hypothetical protein [Streptomyces albus]|uniref:hypothetical protein n=1 Tax=Streptomyces albus TaxID=1888 RepID=UPI0006E3FE86|nr:hypothetical protein [Streptomyces albus]